MINREVCAAVGRYLVLVRLGVVDYKEGQRTERTCAKLSITFMRQTGFVLAMHTSCFIRRDTADQPIAETQHVGASLL
ncbi:hypothetical protein DACRYDRAFT_24139 [Dacryopinax primogenitus]|uniref:Uncharacterized protein n=1 Tax=Dacryopinax primogenitus (strain DJM 731) TaxID=1858805 RepID=M5FSX4_DACPD|nr:uncharacterized protein DACRYDRAFT_24139 [Dacryopinax primogenitus]EJT99063.1 hypothetical protein DACRYDRAFT_24139 [Dacryopinax primogenitus]